VRRQRYRYAHSGNAGEQQQKAHMQLAFAHKLDVAADFGRPRIFDWQYSCYSSKYLPLQRANHTATIGQLILSTEPLKK
jgi:hypothetical protein